jgi:formimidoylglutamate deiminase
MQELWADHILTPGGWRRDMTLRIDAEGWIVDVSPGMRPGAQARGCLVPAPVNAHSHAFQRAMAGLTEARGPRGQDSFWSWRRLMYRFLDTLDPDQVQAIASFAQMEMLETGHACVVEFHYLHHGPGGQPYADPAEMARRIAAAAEETGIGLTLLPVQYQYGGCDQRALAGGQRRFGCDIAGFARLCEGARAAIAAGPGDWGFGTAPHSLRAVAPSDLPAIAELAQGGPVHMHLAEQQAEVDEVRASLGARPVDWVLDTIGPDARWSFVHCTRMLARETEALAATGAQTVLCPITEANLGDGTFDGPRWMDHGGAVAIGSDSNVRISLPGELRQLEYSQRLRDGSRAALADTARSTGRRLWDAVTAGGARAAGRATGALAPGHRADILALDTDHPDMAGLAGDTLLDTFVFARDAASVTDVWAAGRHVVRGGRHIHHDGIAARYLAAVKQLRQAA